MTQEEKELLLKDLCARLPYLPIVEISIYRDNNRRGNIELDPHVTENIWELIDKYHAIPYLRPMLSITEEEKKEFESLGWRVDELNDNAPWNHNSYNEFDGVDWLNKKMFDYHGLIQMGLALEAKEGMYN